MIKKDVKKNNEFFATYQGVTDTSNWIIPHRVLMSAYPGDQIEEIAISKLNSFLNAGLFFFFFFDFK